jgi:hypothetical protein
VRAVATAAGLALLFAGTFWGSDDDFPFAPFRMYAGVNPPDDDAPDPRVEGTLATGAATQLGQAETGIRRAEVEAKQERYVAEPALLAEIAEAYARRHPGAPPVVEVRLVMRWHEIQDSRPTGQQRDEILAVWRAP